MQDEFTAETEAEIGVEISYQLLNPETLEQLIKTFVLRDGTDYGEHEASLSGKIDEIKEQLKKRELKIVFDLAAESGSIVKV
jgi:uncharacterized protein YheU (UPF0270 family)